MTIQHTRNGFETDESVVAELKLYIDNTSELMGPGSQGEAIRKNLMRKIKSGKFDFERSVQGWMYLVESGAKMYTKEFGSGEPGEWHESFPIAIRRQVARELAEHFYTEAKLGNYEHLVKPLLGRLPHKPNARSPKPMSGYAYETRKHWQESSDEDWDTIMYSPSGGEAFLGVRSIDGSRMNVFRLPSGGYIAQLAHMTSNASRRERFLESQARQRGSDPEPRFRLGDQVVDVDGSREGVVSFIVRPYDEYMGGYRYKVREADGKRTTWNETSMQLKKNPASLPRPRPKVDTSLTRVRRMEQEQVARDKPFDPEQYHPRDSKPHHFAVNPSARGDIPAHLTPVSLSENRQPEFNGQQVSYWNSADSHPNYEDPEQWYEVDYATGSDYSGGVVEKANHQELEKLLGEEHPEDAKPVVWANVYGGHGTYSIYVRYRLLSEDVRRTLDQLEDYPAIDDEAVSEVEIEREEEAWENWARKDFEKEFLESFNAEYPDEEPVEDWPEGLDSADLFLIGMSVSNTYWQHEQGDSVYVDLDRVAGAALELMTGAKPPPDWLSPDDWSAVLAAGKAFGLDV